MLILDFGCYYHECFLRDLPVLTCLIRRLPTNLGKSTPYVEGEPNFYLIQERYPLPPHPRGAPMRPATAKVGEVIAAEVGSRPPKVLPATIERPTAHGRPRVASVDLSSSEPFLKRDNNMDNSSPASSIMSDVNKPQSMLPSSSKRVSLAAQDSSAPRLVARASTEPSALAPMPLSLSRHPSAPVPFYYPTSHHGYAHHPHQYSQYPPRYGMFDQYSGGGNPYQRGCFPADHHPHFQQFPQRIPNNGDYPPSRYSEFNPQVDYNFQLGIDNIMDPSNSYGAMGVVEDTERDSLFLKEEEESPDSDDEADEFAPIPIQYSPRSMMRKSDGNSVPKLE
jgi:hypothetical protein